VAPASTHRIPGREVTVMGLETEYGILGAEPEDVVAACLEAEGEAGRSRGVRWDYSGEYPLRDARGFEMDRSFCGVWVSRFQGGEPIGFPEDLFECCRNV